MNALLTALLTICLETLVDFYRIRKYGTDSRLWSWIIRAAGALIMALLSGQLWQSPVLLAGLYFFCFDPAIALVLDKPWSFLGSTKGYDKWLKKIKSKWVRLALRGAITLITIVVFYF